MRGWRLGGGEIGARAGADGSSVRVCVEQGGEERKVQLLSRSLSGSRLNAGAPAFVPKGLQIAFSSSVPGHGQGLGFSPPALVQAPSSVIPVIIPPPHTEVAAAEVFAPAAEEHIGESPPGLDKGPAKEGADGAETLGASDHVGEGEQGGGSAATAMQPAKAVVTEELKAKIVKQVMCVVRGLGGGILSVGLRSGQGVVGAGIWMAGLC